MAITVKHNKVSTIPDDADTSLVRPSDWNDDHVLTGTIPVANGGTGAATLTGYVKGNGTAAMTAATTIPSTDVTGLGTMSTQNSNNISVTGGSISGTTVSGYIPTTEKAAALGVATLDSAGKVPISQIPDSVIGALSYQGTWNASTNTPTLATSVGTKGYYYVVSVAGSTNLNGITDWLVGDWAVYSGSAWQKIDNTDSVTSVNGYTGAVVLTAADVSAVPYTGATAAVDLNAKSLTNVSNLGIGTTTVPTISMRAVGNNNSTSRIAMRGYSSDANSSAIRVTKFRGTVAAPQAPQSGDSLGKFELAGYGTTSSEGYPQASLEGLATEAWGATARGTKAVIKVTPNTTTTQVTALTINQDSTAVFASTVTANGTLLTGNTGTVTSVAATAGTGITVSGSPITTSGTLTITNSAPDQTVVLTAGTGISTTGTYPNFTITNTSPSSGGTVTSVTGTAPVVSSGGNTPAISMAAANTTTNGYLTSTDWNTFNGKGSGTVTSVTATSPVTSTGGTTPVIAMPAATTSVPGYLTAADWTTFNGKQATLVSGTNIKTINTNSILGSGDLTISASAAGSTTQVQYNNSGSFAGNAGFLYDATNGILNLSGSTGALTVPTGTTAQRPATLAAGMIRYNTTLGQTEIYSGTSWITITTQTYSVSYLIVAGGGSGANSSNATNGTAGGGGAGGYLTTTTNLTSGTSYTITVGAGGAAVTATASNVNGNNGSNSLIVGINTAIGGGGGAYPTTAGSGGSGGGGGAGSTAGGSGTAGQGNAGGSYGGTNSAGGGGGASAAGANGAGTQSGVGGAGSSNSISGSSVTYAGGGGGGASLTISAGTGGSGGGGAGGAYLGNGTAGTANTGGGGGASGAGNGGTVTSGAGGSGIVVISYTGSQRGTGGTVTSSGGSTIHTFTSSSTYTA